MEQNRIGIIGIGLVGAVLAEKLLTAGYSIIGYDIKFDRQDVLKRIGGKVAESPRDVANESNIIILSLFSSNIIREVIFGLNGILSAETMPKYIIDTSTVEPEISEEFATQLTTKNIHYLDATISGSSEQIKNKENVLLIGGDQESFDNCSHIFSIIAKESFFIGLNGMGAKAKLAVNLINGLNRAVLAEGFILAESLGLDLIQFEKILPSTPAASKVLELKGKKMIEQDFSVQGRLSQHRKDVAIILQQAQKYGLQLPLSKIHLELLDQAILHGDGDLDNSAIIKEFRRMKHQ